MEPRKLVEAVTECLARAVGAKSPFSEVREYIEQLKADPNWTDAEITEVQTKAIRDLMRQFDMQE